MLAIGATKYRNASNRLPLAVNDAETLAGTLKDAGVGYYRNPPIVKTLFDEEVTAGKIGAAFEELSARVKANDVFVFYIAGAMARRLRPRRLLFPAAFNGRLHRGRIDAQGFGPAQLSAWLRPSRP